MYIDGKYTGEIEGEIFVKEILPGKHEVLITSEKIDDIEFEFEIEKFEEIEKEIVAKPAMRVVKIISQPSGADLYVDGKKVGQTPKFLKLEVGKEHAIRILKPGYKPIERTFVIPKKGPVIEKRYELEKIAVGIIWQRALGGSNHDKAWAVMSISDENFLVLGWTTSNDGNISGYHGGGDAWIVSINNQGNIIWQKCYGKDNSDYARSIVFAQDGGYVVAGYVYLRKKNVNGYHGKGDVWVMKLDSRKNVVWQKLLGGSDRDHAYSMTATPDGGYIVVGETMSRDENIRGNHGNSDFWIVYLDASGKVIWQRCFGGTKNEEAYSVAVTPDGGYIVAGYTESNDGDVRCNHGNKDIWIIKIDRRGKIIWQKCLGGSSDDYAHSVAPAPDGGYIVAGYTYSNDGDVLGNHGGADFWVVRLDENGGIIWQKCLGGSAKDIAYSLSVTPDGGYIVAGYTFSNDGDVSGNHGKSDIWIVKLGWK